MKIINRHWSTFLRATLFCIAFVISAVQIETAEPRARVSNETVTPIKLSDETLKLELADITGKKHTLAESPQPIIVLFFLGLECPVANTYVPEIHELKTKLASEKREVLWLGVHSDSGVTSEAAQKHATEYKIDYPVCLDSNQKLAADCGAKVLGQVVVLHDKKIVYRGRIDDLFATNGKRRDTPSTHELATVLTSLVSKKDVFFSETAAHGCPIPKVKK